MLSRVLFVCFQGAVGASVPPPLYPAMPPHMPCPPLPPIVYPPQVAPPCPPHYLPPSGNMYPVQVPSPSCVTPPPAPPFTFPHPFAMPPVQYRIPLEQATTPHRISYPPQYPYYSNPYLNDVAKTQSPSVSPSSSPNIPHSSQVLQSKNLRVILPQCANKEQHDTSGSFPSPPQANQDAALVVMEMDPLVTEEVPATLEPPLTPLPPPMQPQVLTAAKVAAVKAVNGGRHTLVPILHL